MATVDADVASAERDRRAAAMQLAVGVVAVTGAISVVVAALRAYGGVLSPRKKKKKKDDGVASLDVDDFIVGVVESQIKSNVKHVGKSVIAPFLIASLAASMGCVRRAVPRSPRRSKHASRPSACRARCAAPPGCCALISSLALPPPLFASSVHGGLFSLEWKRPKKSWLTLWF